MIDKAILSRLKIAVVDDHDLVREGLRSLLSANGVKEVDRFGSTHELIDALDSGRSYDFYIVDLELPDLDGFVLIEMVRSRFPYSHIIVSTVHEEIWTLRRLMARDVNAIIYKSSNGKEIIDAIEAIVKGNNYYCEAARQGLALATDSSIHPTPRELEVLYLVSMGKTAKAIACELFVSENTVEAHRKNLLKKLNATNVADLVLKAIEKGYLRKGKHFN